MTEVSVWKMDDQIVMCRDAELPYRCVKTNGSASQRVSVRLRAEWNPLFWGLIYLLFARRITLQIPVSQEVLDKSLRWQRISKLMTVGGAGAVVVVIGLAVLCFEVFDMNARGAAPGVFALIICGAILVATGGPFLWSHWRTFGLTAKRITKTHTWIGGVNKDYLSSLPDWPSK